MKLWDEHQTWQAAEENWDKGAEIAKRKNPLKTLKVLPEIPGIIAKDAKNLKWKSFKYLVSHDFERRIRGHFLKRPFFYGWRYLKSIFRKKSFQRDEDFFFYGIGSEKEWLDEVRRSDTILVVGFSYCQKPFECPSGRFSDQCIREASHDVCRQCDIGKILHALPNEHVIPLLIPTIHYIGDHLFKILHAHPGKKIMFLITACELTLEMFGDFGNMVAAKGIGVRLDGRICNTMRAFELSEVGIKPGLTLVTEKTLKRILRLIQSLRT